MVIQRLFAREGIILRRTKYKYYQKGHLKIIPKDTNFAKPIVDEGKDSPDAYFYSSYHEHA